MVIGHSSYLEKPAENDNNALDKGPPRDVVPIGKQEVVVSGLQASGQLLELAHHLNPFVNTWQDLSHVASFYVQLLEKCKRKKKKLRTMSVVQQENYLKDYAEPLQDKSYKVYM